MHVLYIMHNIIQHKYLLNFNYFLCFQLLPVTATSFSLKEGFTVMR